MNPKFLTSIDKLNVLFHQSYEIYEKETNAILDRSKKYDDYLGIVDDILNAPLPEVEDTKSKGKTRGRKPRKISESDAQETPEKDIKPIHLVTSTKPKRLASQVASHMISKVSHITEHTKLRRPSDGVDLLAQYKSKVLEEVAIKKEKEDSYISNGPETAKENVDTNNLSENEMPPPLAPPKGRKPRQRKIKTEVESSDTDNESQSNESNDRDRPIRSTRTKTRNQNKLEVPKPVRNSSRKKTSDVLIVPEEPIPVIEIDSSIDETVNQEIAKEIPESPKEKNKGKNKDTKNKKVQNEEKTDDESSPERPEKQKEVMKLKSVETGEFLEKSDDKKRSKRDDCTSDEENLLNRAKKRTKKARTKVTTTTNSKKEKEKIAEKIPIVLIENIKQEKIDDFSKSNSEPESKISTPNNVVNQTFEVPKQNSLSKIPILNETFAPVMNSTYCTSPLLNGTVTIEKNPENPKILPIITESSSKANETHEILSELDSIVKSNDKPKLVDVTVTIERNPIVEKLSLERKSFESSKENENDSEKNQNQDHWKKPVEKIVVAEPQLTDDESDISPAKSVPKTPINKLVINSSSEEQVKPKKGLKTKAVFSPYANSPVKKRVAAFEKLGSTEKKSNAATTTRVTRTKTKKILEDKENERLKTTQKPNPKFFTPVNHKTLKTISSDLKAPKPGLTNTASKQNISNASSIVNETQKSNSAVKLTKTEQLAKSKEKEDDAQKKKMALINAKTEESKRLREERMERAKKAREEKERQKEEKLRARQQALAEKEEKIKEDQENLKKLLAQQAAIQKEEEMERKLKLKKQNDLQLQKYYKENERKYKNLPPLPTPHYYDSDDESQEHKIKPKNIKLPEWTEKPNLQRQLNTQLYTPKELIAKLFSIKPITPDLETIFENIPKAYLRRNSSAVWRTPPRYSMMPEAAKNFNYRP